MDEEYILKWRDYHENFFTLAEDLFINEQLTDVTLVCKDQQYEAHRLVLSVCSSYFRSLFTKKNEINKHPIVFLKDIEPRELERLLQYMYSGEVKIPNNQMNPFISAANNLNIRGLCNLQQQESYSPRHLSNSSPAPAPTTLFQDHPKKRPLLKRRHSEKSATATAPASGAASGKENHNGESNSSSASLKNTNGDECTNRSCLSPVKVKDDPDLIHQAGSASLSLGHNADGVSPPPISEGAVVPIIQEDPLPLTVNKNDRFKSTSTATPSLFTVTPHHHHHHHNLASASSSPSASSVAEMAARMIPPRILPPNEPRKSGTCYFCKKAFMKNKQLMNHICPKKPRLEPNNGNSSSTATASK